MEATPFPVLSRLTTWLLIALLVVVAGGVGVVWAFKPGSTYAVLSLLILPGVLLVWRYPIAVPLLLAFVLYTRISDVGITYHGWPSVAQPFVILMAAVALVRRAPDGITRSLWRQIVPWGALLAYCAVVLASAIWARDSSLALADASELAKDLLIAYIMVELFDRPWSLRLAVWAFILAGTLLAGLSVVQGLTHHYSDTFWGLAQAPVRQVTLSQNSNRAAGPIGDPNFYGLVLVALTPLVLFRVRDETARRGRLLALACLAILLGGIILTYSRGDLLTLLVIALLCVPLLGVRWSTIGKFLLLLAPVAALAVPASYWARLAILIPGMSSPTVQDPAVVGRLGSAIVGITIFLDHPIFGVGGGNYQSVYFPYALHLNVPDAAAVPHDLYLQVAAETGVVGLVTFCAAMALVLWSGWRAVRVARDARSPRVAGLYASTMMALAAFLIGSLLLPHAYPRYLWMLVGLVLAASSAAGVQWAPEEWTDC